MNHAYHSKKPVLSKRRKLEKAIIEEWELSPIYVSLVFQFATTQHRDLFARDFNSHITDSEPWAWQNLVFDFYDNIQSVGMDTMGDANSLVIWFEATGEESLGMLFKFFDQHPSMRDTCDDVLLEVSWQNKMGRREETYFSFQYVVGSHVFSHGSFPWFTSTDENGEEVTHTCVLTWADLNALHKGVPRLNDLLTWKKKKMNGTMR